MYLSWIYIICSHATQNEVILIASVMHLKYVLLLAIDIVMTVRRTFKLIYCAVYILGKKIEIRQEQVQIYQFYEH